jgi:transposase InsO family protein
MPGRTTPRQRCRFYERHLRGETYQEIADSEGVSRGCVRYWCRRQRDGGGCRTIYRRKAAGLLSQFHPLVRYCILRLRLEHPRWGPNRIREKLKKRASLRGIALPSEASIGRYLHQWPRFRRRPKKKLRRKRPKEATQVHQRWQIDFKMGIALKEGTLVNLHTVRDPFGEVCLGASVFPAGKVGQRAKRATLEQLRSGLRACFARWGTLPDEIQTDGETIFIGQPQDTFPSLFTLWLVGLGVDHLVIRPGKPTDNAEVERCHRTVNDYAIVGNEDADVTQLQHILDQAVHELAFELSSRAEGCGGVAPVVAHPELLQPRHPFQARHELALFDLKRVDSYLATFTWERKVGKTGQITIGGHHQRYSVGRAYSRHQVLVRFDPTDRHFVFFDVNQPEKEIGRRPARDLDLSDITGLAEWPIGLGVQQLPLPLSVSEGVNC